MRMVNLGNNYVSLQDTKRLIEIVSSHIPLYWDRVVPQEVYITISDKKICAIECSHGKVAKIGTVEIKHDLVQATFVARERSIYVHHNSSEKNSEKIFQYEFLVMFAYAMCENPRFSELTEESVGSHEKFAQTFPLFIFEKSRKDLIYSSPRLYKHMCDLENWAQTMFGANKNIR
jgi:hypothetical protein